MKAQRLCLSVLLAVCLLCCVRANGELTEADFKGMKIKELKAFLNARGLSCVGCQEKSDFVRVAYANREKKASSSAPGSRSPPNSKLWEAWSKVAAEVCRSEVEKRGVDSSAEPYATVCSTISTGVDSFFMQHGKQIASRLKKRAEDLLKTSYKDVYYDAGVTYMKRMVNRCIVSSSAAEKCESLGHVMALMKSSSTDFGSWLTNVGIENTNPMYEILRSTDGDL